MTYGDVYDEYLCDVHNAMWKNLPLWVTGGSFPHELMKANDPIMYRCGFSDWLDGVEDMMCECGETIPKDYIVNECDDDDVVQCAKCKEGG